MKLILMCLLMLMAAGGQAKAQGQDTNSGNSLQENIDAYFKAAYGNAVIYTGREEVKYPSSFLNDPYLYTKEYKEGTLTYDGVFYPDVRLRLNCHKEELVTLSPDGRYNVVLLTERVDSASIGNLFLFYNRPATGIGELPAGYFVRLHNGRHPVLKRETCFLQSNIKDMKVENSFAKINRLYILKDGTYKQVKSKGGVLKLFKPKKKELKRYIKDSGLNYKASPDEFVSAVTRYYETLTP